MEKTSDLSRFFVYFIIAIVSCVFILIFIAFFTLTERKLMGLLQRREGPDKVGFEGILQPIADGVKLAKKEVIKPKDNMNPFLFSVAPMISFTVSVSLWSLIPLNSYGAFSNPEISILLILGISSFGSYGVIYSGWASNNKYALMGSLRSVAQIISYEIIFSILFIPVIALSRSFNLSKIVEYQEINGWFGWYLLPLSFIFFIIALAETNRTPFDLPEAEAELVSGYNVEYSSLIFALFFLAEYSSMGIISALFVTCFWGGWSTNMFGNNNKINGNSSAITDQFMANLDNWCFSNIKKIEIISAPQFSPFTRQQSTSSNYFYRNIINDLDFIENHWNATRFGFLAERTKFFLPPKKVIGYFTNIFNQTKKNNNFFTYKFGYDGNYRPIRFEIRLPGMEKNISNLTNINNKIIMNANSFDHYENTIKNFIINNYFFINEYFIDYNPLIQSFISAIKIVFFCLIFIFVRAALPRKRFDQLIFLCWKFLFPLVLGFVIFIIGILVYKIRVESDYKIFNGENPMIEKIYDKFKYRTGYMGTYYHKKYYNSSDVTLDVQHFTHRFLKIIAKDSLLNNDAKE